MKDPFLLVKEIVDGAEKHRSKEWTDGLGSIKEEYGDTFGFKDIFINDKQEKQ